MAATLGGLAVLAGVFAMVVTAAPARLLNLHYVVWGPAYQEFSTSVQQLVCAVLVLLLYLRPPRLPGWVQAVVTRVSVYSYSAYLIHVVVMTMTSYYVPQFYHGFPGLGLSLAGTVVATILLHHAVERPGMMLRDAIPLALDSLRAQRRLRAR